MTSDIWNRLKEHRRAQADLRISALFAADPDHGAPACLGPFGHLRFPRGSGKHQEAVIGCLGQIDVDVAPIAGLTADGRPPRTLAEHQCPLLGGRESVRRCAEMCLDRTQQALGNCGKPV